MLQAAMQGLGLCLASERLAHQHLAEGRLVQPVRTPLGRKSPLCISAWTRNIDRPPVKALWDWILQECRQSPTQRSAVE
jgi:DNA-binding transcriptional LysR family regulator